MPWYPSFYAPRTGGAYDRHHRTAGIAGRSRRRCGDVAARGARAAGRAHAAHRRAHEHNCGMIRKSSPASRYSCKYSLSSRESDLPDPCQPTAYYAQKPRTETEEKACSSERAKEAVRQFQHYAARAPVIDAATPRAAVGNGATPRAARTKNKKDREAHNGCCPCGHRDSPVCLCVYFDETMRRRQQRGRSNGYRQGCFPVGERGHRWLPESRPAVPSSGTHMCYRAAAALPFTAQAQEAWTNCNDKANRPADELGREGL